MASNRSKAIYHITKENKLIENKGTPIDFTEVVQQKAAKVKILTCEVIHSQNEAEFAQSNLKENVPPPQNMLNIKKQCSSKEPPLEKMHNIEQLAEYPLEEELNLPKAYNIPEPIAECFPMKEPSSPKTYHSLEPAYTTASFPELRKEDLTGLNENLCESSNLHIPDFDSDLINECHLLDLTNKNKQVTYHNINTGSEACRSSKTVLQKNNYKYFIGNEDTNNNNDKAVDLTKNSQNSINQFDHDIKYDFPKTSTPKQGPFTQCSLQIPTEASSIIPDESFESSVEELIEQLSREKSNHTEKICNNEQNKTKRKLSVSASTAASSNSQTATTEKTPGKKSKKKIKRKLTKCNNEKSNSQSGNEQRNNDSVNESSMNQSEIETNCTDSVNRKSDKNRPVKRRERNAAKRLKLEKEKYTMRPPCNESCRRKCFTKFTNEERYQLWSNFRNLSKQSQRNFISRNVRKNPTKCKTAGNSSRRHNTLIWTLRNTKVCKMFFLNTLGYTNAKSVITVLKANYKNRIVDVHIQDAAPEQRGRSKPWNCFEEGYKDKVKIFIEKVKPTVSHYNLKHAPNRRYIPCGVSFTDLFNLYKTHCEENQIKVCSWGYFYQIIKEMNLSTSNPKQDLCTTCQNHNQRHGDNEDHLCGLCECDICKNFPEHIQNMKESRNSLEYDEKNSNETRKIFTADMQKAICMPKLTIKDYYFSRKLVMFNETFVSPGENQPAYCIIWHEGESGRKAHNIATSYVQFITTYARDLKEVIIYCDNCTSQNKNRTLYTAMLRLVNSDSLITADKIRFVYLEPGHTYMAADHVHACITNKFLKCKEMYDHEDYIDKIQKSRKNTFIQTISHSDMILFRDELKKGFPKTYNIQALKIVEFRRGSTSIFAKNTYRSEFRELKVLKNNIIQINNEHNDYITNLPREANPRGISLLKKQELMKLTISMPLSRRQFYENLLVNKDVCDLDTVIEN